MVNEIQAVMEELGGESLLGHSLRTAADAQAAIREGFPRSVIDEVMRSADLRLKEVAAAIDLSPRSLQRLRKEWRLTPFQSDRLYRLARIVVLAKRSLGDAERALRWLKRPNRALGGVAPLEAIDTEPGARMVENILGRIAYGGVS